jgi:hypothetical protein
MFKKKSTRQKFKEKIVKLLESDAEILEDSKIGFFVKIIAEPSAYFHVSDNGIVVETSENREDFIKRGVGCSLLTAILMGD